MRRCGVAIASAVIGIAFALPASGPAAASKCAAPHSTTILQNSKVRVFKQDTRDGVRGFDVYACLKSGGQTTILGNSAIDDYPFLPPALALARTVVGYAHEVCDEEFCATSVIAIDMRHPHDYRGDLNGSYAGPPGHRLVKVGSLRVTRRGSLIWIACPEKRHSKLTGSRKPTCVRAGARDAVYLSVPGGPAFKRLDRGTTIDPSSLELTAHHARWRHGHHWRRATVP
jgi:hypothetical protein